MSVHSRLIDTTAGRRLRAMAATSGEFVLANEPAAAGLAPATGPRVLIANRALAALKFINSINEWRRLSPDNRVTLVGVVTDEDMESGYLYIELLDEVVLAASDVYMNEDMLVTICAENNIQMLWPGWGYLSEQSSFVEKVSAAAAARSRCCSEAPAPARPASPAWLVSAADPPRPPFPPPAGERGRDLHRPDVEDDPRGRRQD